jgi:DNA repair protein RadC
MHNSLRRSDALECRHPDDEEIVEIAVPLGISVHDHIIVGKNGHAGLKGLKLM